MYEYKIIRSKRKTLAVQVTENCEIIVRAPYLCPERKIKKFLDEHEEWLEKALSKQQEVRNSKIKLTDDDIKYLKKLAGEVLPRKVEYYAAIMGVHPENVKITSAQKRFGSCSGKNNICFSYMLMLYPEEAVDYVVVHELAHTVHHNHSRDFYSLIEKILPDYRKREKLLRGPQIMP